MAMLRPMGQDAVLVEVGDIASVVALDAVLRPLLSAGRGPWSQVEDLVPAATTLLIRGRPGRDVTTVGQAALEQLAQLRRSGTTPAAAEPRESVEIAVTYDGPDLPDVAEATGLTPHEVVTAHTGTPWRVGFFGFAPGFAYLVGGDPRLQVPRRREPRTTLPAGSVALAGEFSAVYPRTSPGGWQLIGRTTARMWDTERTPPALLAPGMHVRFVAEDPP